MFIWPLLSVTIFLPLFGSIVILLIREDEKSSNNIKWAALCTSIGTFILSCLIWLFFDSSISSYQLVEKYKWFDDFNFYYHIGVDGISLFMILLSTFLTPFCILASWDSIKKRIKEYMVAFLLLETFMIGMFSSVDILLFYIFFEAVLIPMFIIIGVWGGERRIYASFKFFLYTLLGSVLMLIAIIFIYQYTNIMNIEKLQGNFFPFKVQFWLWLAFFASFAVKIPMWPFHTWLPDAHVEAPTAGSVILAGVLLKMGGYGFIRFSLGMLPLASEFFLPLIYILSIIAIVYTSFVALAQTDIKKLIAYSSVAHMGIVTIGIFVANQQGVEGAMIQMISHGIVSAALFLCVGVIYDRAHSREIAFYGGLVNRMPLYAASFMIFTLASVGLPGTSGFIGEFLTIIGAFKINIYLAFFVASGIILSAVYMLYLYKRIIFGTLTNEKIKDILDLNIREKIIMVSLIAVVLLIGIYPNLFLDPMRLPIETLIENYDNANAK
ncbi:MAG: NADH-quinone oxidoreductase subunit M [Alphaproteobacteria bacterium MarineAlpha5_Bin6]|nr:MAG: NADH-quinone oxidoreductase subunit M [Alphaproteobacteria bacterium MarineAlpha5_Bin7]PPR53688.1 MAG: NADH-quinone oxidoreductase subunit M [Alphaproteobacteria bacterium MarineAlpha5_Bin6]|tara:strand:+ start:1223 stop:2707 length:1485 start_codon:yes stop_codon:yes gene_type:complete